MIKTFNIKVQCGEDRILDTHLVELDCTDMSSEQIEDYVRETAWETVGEWQACLYPDWEEVL